MNKIREVILDTETTGLDPVTVTNPDGHKIIEIAGIELIDHIPTGEEFHVYIDPKREVPEASVKIHGITKEFLSGKPQFKEIEDELYSFLQDSTLIIHNAEFDIKFLEAETSLEKQDKLQILKQNTIDTLKLARKKRPDLRSHSLDSLGEKLEIDMTGRENYHGALIDCHILAGIYYELIYGQKQKKMFDDQSFTETLPKTEQNQAILRQKNLNTRITEEELNRHKNFISSINAEKNWNY